MLNRDVEAHLSQAVAAWIDIWSVVGGSEQSPLDLQETSLISGLRPGISSANGNGHRPTLECDQPEPIGIHHTRIPLNRHTHLLYTVSISRLHPISMCINIHGTTDSSQCPPHVVPVKDFRTSHGILLVCFYWNKGACSYGARCKYQYVCANCAASHKALEPRQW